MLKLLPICHRLKGSINMTAPISHSKSAKYSSENTWQRWKQVYPECLVIVFILHPCEERSWQRSLWLITGSLSPVCHMSTWLSWNCSPWNPLSWMTLLVEQSNPDGRCEAAALLSAGCHGRLWGPTAAETSARPGSYLHSSVSCPSSQLLTLLPTCGLRPTPGGLTASHRGRS